MNPMGRRGGAHARYEVALDSRIEWIVFDLPLNVEDAARAPAPPPGAAAGYTPPRRRRQWSWWSSWSCPGGSAASSRARASTAAGSITPRSSSNRDSARSQCS